jgi:hypothetical protein
MFPQRKGPANGTSSIKLALRNRFDLWLKAGTESEMKFCVLITPKTMIKVQEIKAILHVSSGRFGTGQSQVGMPYFNNHPDIGCWNL